MLLIVNPVRFGVLWLAPYLMPASTPVKLPISVV
jgi:hypothetical protein